MKHRLRRIVRRLKDALRPYLIRGRLLADSPDFKRLFQDGASIRRLAGGFRFTEGPVWDGDSRRLLFSDIPGDTIYFLDAGGRVKVLRHPSGMANGLALDHQGRLIACEHGNRRVTRTESDGSITVLADRFDGARLNSPNDVAVASDGAVFFTDPIYGIKKQQQELPCKGVYRCQDAGTEPELVVDDFEAPNGLAFTPGGRTLYVDDSSLRCHIRVFSLENGGRLAGGDVFCDMTDPRPGPPDGIALDAAGRVYCAGPAGLWVIDIHGKRMGIIATPEQPANCAFGGPDLTTLFITARSSVYAIDTTTPGLRLPVRTTLQHTVLT